MVAADFHKGDTVLVGYMFEQKLLKFFVRITDGDQFAFIRKKETSVKHNTYCYTYRRFSGNIVLSVSMVLTEKTIKWDY